MTNMPSSPGWSISGKHKINKLNINPGPG